MHTIFRNLVLPSKLGAESVLWGVACRHGGNECDLILLYNNTLNNISTEPQFYSNTIYE
jgi:hypothetical protein